MKITYGHDIVSVDDLFVRLGAWLALRENL